MKNSYLAIIAVVIAAVAAVGIFTIFGKNPSSSSESSTMQKEESTAHDETLESKTALTPDDKIINSDTSQKYVGYTKLALESAADTRRVLFFYANWCPTCRPTDENLKSNLSKFPEDVTVIRVNYNDSDTDQEEKDLAKKYGVTYQHTFVQIDKAGKEVTKWNGGKIEELLKNII